MANIPIVTCDSLCELLAEKLTLEVDADGNLNLLCDGEAIATTPLNPPQAKICYENCVLGSTTGPSAGKLLRTVWDQTGSGIAGINQANSIASNYPATDQYGLPWRLDGDPVSTGLYSSGTTWRVDDISATTTNEELIVAEAYVNIPPSSCLGGAKTIQFRTETAAVGAVGRTDQRTNLYVSSTGNPADATDQGGVVQGNNTAGGGTTPHAGSQAYTVTNDMQRFWLRTYGVDGVDGGVYQSQYYANTVQYSTDGGTTWQSVPNSWIAAYEADATLPATLTRWECQGDVCVDASGANVPFSSLPTDVTAYNCDNPGDPTLPPFVASPPLCFEEGCVYTPPEVSGVTVTGWLGTGVANETNAITAAPNFTTTDSFGLPYATGTPTTPAQVYDSTTTRFVSSLSAGGASEKVIGEAWLAIPPAECVGADTITLRTRNAGALRTATYYSDSNTPSTATARGEASGSGAISATWPVTLNETEITNGYLREYIADTTLDGYAVLEYSKDGGATWVAVPTDWYAPTQFAQASARSGSAIAWTCDADTGVCTGTNGQTMPLANVRANARPVPCPGEIYSAPVPPNFATAAGRTSPQTLDLCGSDVTMTPTGATGGGISAGDANGNIQFTNTNAVTASASWSFSEAVQVILSSKTSGAYGWFSAGETWTISAPGATIKVYNPSGELSPLGDTTTTDTFSFQPTNAALTNPSNGDWRIEVEPATDITLSLAVAAPSSVTLNAGAVNMKVGCAA